MPRNVIITGGVYHPFEEASAVLAGQLAKLGIDSQITLDVDAGLKALERAQMLTIFALRWRMLDDEKYAPHRAKWAFELDETGRAAITAFLARGGGLLGLHTATLCFDTWPQWKDLLGARWIWGRSHHPPQGPVSVRTSTDQFTVNDEVYQQLEHADGNRVLAWAHVEGEQAEHPIFWTRHVGAGRVVYDALGHDGASLSHPAHAAMIAAASRWLVGEAEEET